MFERVDSRILVVLSAVLLASAALGYAFTTTTSPTATQPAPTDSPITTNQTSPSPTTSTATQSTDEPSPRTTTPEDGSGTETSEPPSTTTRTTTPGTDPTTAETSTTTERTSTTTSTTTSTNRTTTATTNPGDNTGDDESGDDTNTGDDSDDGDNDGGETTPDDPEQIITPPPGRSSAYYRFLATQLLDESTLYSNAPNPNDPAAEQLNETFDYYSTLNRTTSNQVFVTDVGLATRSDNHNLTRLLVASDRQLAVQAIADADAVVRSTHARGVPADWSALNATLDDARGHLQDAKDARTGSSEPSNAILAYEAAWLDAQRVIDALNQHQEPRIALDSRRDPIRSNATNYTIQGSITDVRPNELSNVTINIDGKAQTTVPIRTNGTLSSTARFAATVTLPAEPVNVSAVVTDPGVKYSENATYDPQQASVTIALDRDGLTDVEEAQIGTDPLDPDSVPSDYENKSRAGNGVLDGQEDYDGDGLPTRFELDTGLDPLSNDTDGDRLYDGFEMRYDHLNATVVDTDGDGTIDAYEDYDNDTLPAINEQAQSSSPIYADTDADGWNDSVEFEKNTSAVLADTDDDGLIDPAENTTPFRTDPTDPDTDGDGVLDGNETYETTTTNESLNVTVAINGTGNVADYTRVHRQTRDYLHSNVVDNVSRGPMIEVESRRNVTNATITFRYDDDDVAINGERSLAVYRYNRSQQTFVRLNSTVDAANDTVSAQTPHFSTYVLFQTRAWRTLTDREQPSPYSVNEEFTNEAGWTGDGEIRGSRVVVDPEAREANATTTTWPTLGGSANRSGHVGIDGATDYAFHDSIDILIEVGGRRLAALYFSAQQPVVEGDTIYTTGNELQDRQYVYRVNADTETVVWKTPVGEQAWSDNGISAGDGRVYAHVQGAVVALDKADGSVIWNRSVPCGVDDGGAPLVVTDRVVVGCEDGVYALDSTDGSRIWTAEVSDSFQHDEFGLAAGDGTVFFANETQLVGVDVESGNQVLSTETAPRNFGLDRALMYANGTVYAATAVGVSGYDSATGERELLIERPENQFFAGPPSVGNGRIIIGADSSSNSPELVLAYDTETGERLWRRTMTAHEHWGVDVTTANGNAYVTSDQLYVLDAATGRTLSNTTRVPEYSDSSPVVTDEKLYVFGSFEEYVYSAVPENASERAWSTYAGGSARTGQVAGDGPQTFGEERDIEDGGPDSIAASERVAVWSRTALEDCTEYPCPPANRTVTVYDRQTESIVWTDTRSTADPRTTVSLANGRVFALSSNGTVTAYGQSNGTVVWTRTTNASGPIQDGRERRTRAPAADSGRLYFSYGHTVFALDQATGETIWKTSLSNASAGAVAVDDGTVAVTTQDLGIVALNATSGEKDWRTDIDAARAPRYYTSIATPVIENGQIYVAAPSAVLELDAETGSSSVIEGFEGTSVASMPAVENGQLYVLQQSTDSRDGSLVAISTSSHERLWSRTADLGASGRILAGEDTVYVASTQLESYEAATGIPIDKSGFIWEVAPSPFAATEGAFFISDYFSVNRIPSNSTDATTRPRSDDRSASAVDVSTAEATVSKTFTVRAARNATLEVGLSAYLRGQSGSVSVRVFNEGGSKRVFALNSLEDEAVIGRQISSSLDGFHGETVTVEVVVRGEARAAVDYLRYYADSDGDGLTDNEEREGFLTSMGRTITTSPALADSDRDGLDDGRELDVTTGTGRRGQITRSLELVSDPTDSDSDNDGLDDHTEVTGWTVNVTYRGEDQDGRPYRWDWSDDPDATMNVSSNPLAVDSDFDGATDFEEKNVLHTDPESWRTYEITIDHEQDILQKISEMDASRRRAFIEAMNLPCYGGSTCESSRGTRLVVRAASDGTDDFDFVYPGMERGKSFDNLNDRIQFTALDGTTRVDTWVRNVDEIDHDTDPWDPDTDDDGLTDGQELEHILKILPPETGVNHPVINVRGSWTDGQVSSPTNPDTDGDGYWDGWLAVYGVERTADVILYRHHLWDDDDGDGDGPTRSGPQIEGEGIVDDEMVPEQAGVHPVDGSTGRAAAYAVSVGPLDDVHSNIHIGERHWAAVDDSQSPSPVDSSSTPNTTLPVEVDWEDQVSDTKLDPLPNATRNYRLYGLDVRFERGNEVSLFGDALIRDDDRPEAAYVVVKQNIGSGGKASSMGGCSTGVGGGYLQRPGARVEANDPNAFKNTLMHELAHLIGIGRNDYAFDKFDEVYSSSDEDPTPEHLKIGEDGDPLTHWTIMASGYQPDQIEPPMNRTYLAFSLEELMTVEFHEVESTEDCVK